MIRYAVIRKADVPDPLPVAPVMWEFNKGDTPYIGLEWGDGDTVPPLGREWLTFVDTDEFNTWIDQ